MDDNSVAIETDFVACAPNNAPKILDVHPIVVVDGKSAESSRTNLILFGSSNQLCSASVAESSTSTDRSSTPPITLKESYSCHSKNITSVAFFDNQDDQYSSNIGGQQSDYYYYAVAACTEGNFSVWNYSAQNGSLTLQHYAQKAHDMSIESVSGFRRRRTGDDEQLFVLTASPDSTIKLWSSSFKSANNDPRRWTLAGSLDLSPKFVLTTCFVELDGHLLVASGVDDGSILLHEIVDVGVDEVESDKPLHKPTTFQFLAKIPGHKDWIRSLAFNLSVFSTNLNGKTVDQNLLLASSSQDNQIRVWKFALIQPASSKRSEDGDNKLKLKNIEFSLAAEIGEKENDGVGTEQGRKKYSIVCETILSGHDSWVYSVRWINNGNKNDHSAPPELLSASMDKSIILWHYDDGTGLWLEKNRVGEVGGMHAGFYGALPISSSSTISATEEDKTQQKEVILYVVGHSYNGGLYLWHQSESGDWQPGLIGSGHFDAVTDIGWEPKLGRFLVSSSLDQTTRLYASYKYEKTRESGIVGMEISRPQVHGWGVQCLKMGPKLTLISGSEEKLLRSFQAPASFLTYFEGLTGDKIENVGQLAASHSAAQPALGLSNLATGGAGGDANEGLGVGMRENEGINRQPVDLKDLPATEDMLRQETLWPELHKLYGHGNEIYCLDVTAEWDVVASACRARDANQAIINLWDTKDWQLRGKLPVHNMTVTQLAFSPDSAYLLSVSRDRTWALHRRRSAFDWELLGQTNKTNCLHSRILWGCAWTWDSRYFITVSRDKKVVGWGLSAAVTDKEENGRTINQLPAFASKSDVFVADDSVTAVSVANGYFDPERRTYLVACGLESGQIDFMEFDPSVNDEQTRNPWKRLAKSKPHGGTVEKLRFKPQVDGSTALFGRTINKSSKLSTNCWQLASCSSDHSVKVFTVSKIFVK